MIDSRRKFLKTLAVGVIGGEVISTFPISALAKSFEKGIEIQKGYIVFNADTQKILEQFIEAIIPGSKEINMKDKILNYVNKDRAAATIFDAGLWNIDALSRSKYEKPFYELEDKKEINTLMEYVSKKNKPFFFQFRYLIMRLYFTDPRVWKKISYNGPPQTKGFMDYAEPPKIKK